MNRKLFSKYCRIILLIIIFCIPCILPLFAMGIEEYRDTFSLRDTTWPQREDGSMKARKADGGYLVEGRERTAASMVGCSIDLNRDFDIETTISFLEGKDDVGYGLLWGASRQSSLYYFFLSSSGSYCYGKVADDADEPIIKWEPFPAIQPNGTNTLNVKRRGYAFQLSINNQPVTHVKSEPPFGHLFGFGANSGVSTMARNFFVRGYSPEVPDDLSVLYEGNLRGKVDWKNPKNEKVFKAKLYDKSRITVYRPFNGDAVTVSSQLKTPGNGVESSVNIYLQTEEGALLKLERIDASSGAKVRFSASGQGKDLGSKEIPLPDREITLKLTRQKDVFKGEAISGNKNVEVGTLTWPRLSQRQTLGLNMGYEKRDNASPAELSLEFRDFVMGKP